LRRDARRWLPEMLSPAFDAGLMRRNLGPAQVSGNDWSVSELKRDFLAIALRHKPSHNREKMGEAQEWRT